ncbi:MAG TPA: hypothetical protein VN765_12835, partial [Candidatus Acidoferrum sp.]|nr:hypothetical protein [Candidatus Acidoferrum sp.]
MLRCDPNAITQWGYDPFGRVTNKVDATSTTILKYQYDPDGRLTNRWSLGRTNTAYGYDNAGNLTNVNYQASHALFFAYDAVNRLTNMIDAAGTNSLTYSKTGRLVSEQGLWASDGVSNAYFNGQRTNLTLQQPSGLALVETYAYDAANRLYSIAAPPGTFSYQYASGAQSLVSKITLPNSAYVSNFYDSLTRLTNTTLFNSTNGILDYSGYTYNNANQRTEELRAALSFPAAV